MVYDYTKLLNSENDNFYNTWRDIYDSALSLPQNFLYLLRHSVYLPFDHYRIIAAYAFIPSVFARIVPYLFLYGVSGSGKSTIGKLISFLHGIEITSSSTTFAAIRNKLEDRRKRELFIQPSDPKFPGGYLKEVPANTCMVWDDIDATTFTSNNDIYRLFKFGYDASCDTIEVSSDVTGQNLKFRCFCPKTFSSISPLHVNEQLKELRRRLIVIPTKKIEDLSDVRKQELGIDDNNWETKLINIDAYRWKGFGKLFHEFWDLELSELYLTSRKLLANYIKGYRSNERAISIDLITTGVVTGIWNNEDEAIIDVKNYWRWFKSEVTVAESPLIQLLTSLVKQEQTNAFNGGIEPSINNQQIRAHCDIWYQQGQLLDRPTSKTISEAMNQLGYRLVIGGQWVRL